MYYQLYVCIILVVIYYKSLTQKSLKMSSDKMIQSFLAIQGCMTRLALASLICSRTCAYTKDMSCACSSNSKCVNVVCLVNYRGGNSTLTHSQTQLLDTDE